MDIRPEGAGLDPLARQRQIERAAQQDRRSGASSGTDSGSRTESRVDLAPADLDRFVAELAGHDPVDLHRVEDLRERIAAGQYNAEPGELVDGLLDVLNAEDGTL
ncbi:MAG: flagellar biosynthesis anti-sigma factor FlgM [Planctomycetota bacterium]|nr:flagellar biosynthesis anti-sigma factor FlgM [Planctomycetota bacterium]